MNKSKAINIINASMGREMCDLRISNATVIDVYGGGTFKADIYIKDGRIVGFDGNREAKEHVDAKGQYAVPGFIDGHCHIESSHLSPSEFSDAVVPCGTTTVIADPHEICNVSGLDAMKYMLSSAKDAPLDIFYMFPSCVPATPFEHSGAILNAKEIETLIDNDRILGLGEMMNYVGVINTDEVVMDKLECAYKRGKNIDGHVPSIQGQGLDAYIAAGITTDHECESPEELKEKVRKGMYVLLRQGTACKNVLQLLPGVDDFNYKRCLFCTDDRQPQSIIREGHINYGVSLAIKAGLDPIKAISAASLNAAECFNLKDRGAIAPGKRADLFLTQSLEDLKPSMVFIEGRKAAEDGRILIKAPHVKPEGVEGMMNVKDLSLDTFRLELKTDEARVIKIVPGGVVTLSTNESVKRDSEGLWVHDKDKDILKITVIERHHGTGYHASGLIKGYGMKHGAVGTSIAHDSHNLIIIGDNDDDMLSVARKLVELGGGITMYKDGRELMSHRLEIAGLMTDESLEDVVKCLDDMHDIAERELEVSKMIDPFMTLCFMALPVIPELKITDCGLFDVTTFSFTDISI